MENEQTKIYQMIISLTGGLGNQIFQMFAGLYYSRDEVFLTSEFGSPRCTNGIPDLFHFNLPSRVKKLDVNLPADKVKLKFGGFALRRYIVEDKISNFRYSEAASSFLLNSFFSIYLNRRLEVFSSREVGFCEESPAQNALIFGYFQSYKYFDALNFPDNEINLRYSNEHYKELKTLAVKEKPIFVHVRLTDYSKEKHFGTLSSRYYSQGLDLIEKNLGQRKIWLFSDQAEKALSLLPRRKLSRIFVVPKQELSPAQTLNLMRYGTAYLIANSTFSWWGAKLSYIGDPMVVAPQKWFAGMDDPKDILPVAWITGES
jgi:hypothetical protein